MQIRRETCLSVVREVLQDPRAELVASDRSAMGGGVTGEVGATGGVERLTGTALSHGREVPWTVIRKVLRRQRTVSAPGIEIPTMDPSGWMYWRREADVYGSSLLDDLDGLIAPRCFAIDQGEDAVALWLEDFTGEGPLDWPLVRYGLAARHLGRFGGRHLGIVPLPQLPWLSRGRVTEWLDLGGPGIEAKRTDRRGELLCGWLA